MTFFSFFKYFDAFELDVSVVNFVYYGKTRFRSNSRVGLHWAKAIFSLMFVAAKGKYLIGFSMTSIWKRCYFRFRVNINVPLLSKEKKKKKVATRE